ncbi:two-component system, OmpR family, response regulator ResD [Paenibacillus algorifonticola]|uniref:Two-component system, OmpR family, response regulator ResD n=1 Tax=Paenibacillus algorifonticola TaxID=684063 RepID=A0A1I1YWS5_9BACL|nr:response regulator transcription factor [Paenibacillus algorifonticola]SFE24044.1 two-component system, OmpR family, response regulator ResD [Paenibacillus algorifonticola]
MKQKKSVILIISQEKHTQAQLKSYFLKEGYHTDTSYHVKNAWLKSNRNHYGLIIIDHAETGLSNIQLCIAVRKRLKTPIMLITENGKEDQRLAGFEAGADDCMEKPFSYKEMVWRTKAILRRSTIQALNATSRADYPTIKLSRLTINPSAHRILVDGTEIHLSLKEFDLLYYLALHADIVHTRSHLLGIVWRQSEVNDYRTVDTHIKRLREKLTPISPDVGAMIKTVRGVGYIFSKGKHSNMEAE